MAWECGTGENKGGPMTIIQAIILGIIQGLTEFIPVSSTGHLLITQSLMGIEPGDATFAFLVLVQMGTIVSLVVYFWEDLLALIRAFFARPFSTQDNRLGWFIIIATIPALLAGVLLNDAVEALFMYPLIEASIRLFTAALLMSLAEVFGKRTRSLENMNWIDSLIVGVMQILAVFPGASRSGTTISAGLFRGFDRPSAARFAFLMSIPVMVAAGLYELLDILKMPDLSTFLPVIAVGFITAAIVGWLAIKWLMKYLSHHSLYIFAGYCAVMGSLILVYGFFLI
jgi:undecaprenyl-diphosphatase